MTMSVYINGCLSLYVILCWTVLTKVSHDPENDSSVEIVEVVDGMYIEAIS